MIAVDAKFAFVYNMQGPMEDKYFLLARSSWNVVCLGM